MAIGTGATVTTAAPDLDELCVEVAVIVAEPSDMLCTTPPPSTVAIAGLLLDQVTVVAAPPRSDHRGSERDDLPDDSGCICRSDGDGGH